MFVGSPAPANLCRRFATYFKRAKENSPCLIFIDEIDGGDGNAVPASWRQR